MFGRPEEAVPALIGRPGEAVPAVFGRPKEAVPALIGRPGEAVPAVFGRPEEAVPLCSVDPWRLTAPFSRPKEADCPVQETRGGCTHSVREKAGCPFRETRWKAGDFITMEHILHHFHEPGSFFYPPDFPVVQSS